MCLHIIKRFVADSAGKRGVARHDYDVLVASLQIAPDRHAQPSGTRRPRMTGTIAIVLAFRPQKKTIQATVLPHPGKAIEPPGKHFMHVTLMTDIHDKSVPRRVEDAMQRNGQLDHAEIR